MLLKYKEALGRLLTCDCARTLVPIRMREIKTEVKKEWECTKKATRIKIEKLMMSCIERLSVRGRQVLVSEHQVPGMTRGSVRHRGALLTERHLATQQVRSAPE